MGDLATFLVLSAWKEMTGSLFGFQLLVDLLELIIAEYAIEVEMELNLQRIISKCPIKKLVDYSKLR